MHSNDYATAQSVMVSVAVSSLGATQLHILEPSVSTVIITRILFCWICFCRLSALFSGITTFFSKMGHQHIVHVTLSPCCRERETPEFIPPEMWPPNSPDLNLVDYSIWGMLQERVYRSRIHDVKELKERLLREWRLLEHTVIAAAIAQWRSRLNACVPVNRGHFEHKFWASDFLLCFVCFIDTGSCKCDRYKHVQSANIGVKCVTFVFETFTQYGSNVTSVWQEIFMPMTLTLSHEVLYEKL